MTSVAPLPIPTPRLRLLPLRVADATEMAGVLGDQALHAYTGGAPEDPAVLRARYERWVAGSPDPAVTWCNWVVHLRSERCLVGTVQATVEEVAGHRRAEVAWVVGSRWQRRGIATEAAGHLVHWLVERSVHEVVAHIHPDHRASAAVAAAAGLVPTDHRQDGEVRWALPTPRRSSGPAPTTDC
ncbi:GNAT family N-acetyltransferase [Streptomyces sp. NPDC059740]|uniref:GNAT family N-acetyltransferase n=1 Tax=Streptomyces sp. NPDC059740 TaxID=3346926 RepID=UPI0036606CF9